MKLFGNYMRRTAEIQVDGDIKEDNLVNLIDYIVDPCIQLKNYVVIADTQAALSRVQNSQELFEDTKLKIKYLLEHKYNIETRIDSRLKPMLEQEISHYYQIFEQLDKKCRQMPIEVVSHEAGRYQHWFITSHNNEIPSINKLRGFKNVVDQMTPYYKMLYTCGVLNNDKEKQTEFIIAYTKELFWVL